MSFIYSKLGPLAMVLPPLVPVDPGSAQNKIRSSDVLPAPLKVTTVEGITEYLLANGLRVLLFPDAGKPSLTVNITYMVGSVHENYGETGMAHLLEHLLAQVRRLPLPLQRLAQLHDAVGHGLAARLGLLELP